MDNMRRQRLGVAWVVFTVLFLIWLAVWVDQAHAQAINPGVTQANISQTICVSGWTATVRPSVSYTGALKRKLAKAQGVLVKDYELDHVVPLEVGGAPSDPKNLKLQIWTGPDGAHAKDVVENRMHRMVCARTITLYKARQCFFNDWHNCPTN
jgi:hypothetical protein